MQSVNVDAIKRLENTLGDMLGTLPQERAKLHKKIGEAVKQELDNNITESVNDIHLAVRRWQIVSIGSGGGYAAIRPMGSKEGGISGPNGQGSITNYLNEGHAIRKPRTISVRYRSRARLLFVPGRKFYQNTEGDAERVATQEAQQWAGEICKKIEQG